MDKGSAERKRRGWVKKILDIFRSEVPTVMYSPWQRYWGHPYGLPLKEKLLTPVFEKLEDREQIGNLVIDAGSGAMPVTKFLPAKAGRKRICVDIAAENRPLPDGLMIRLDLEKVGEANVLGFRKALIRVCKYLRMDPRRAVDVEIADTMIFSEILNYVDFRAVLSACSRYLKTGGRMVVVHSPIRGNRDLFSEKGLKDNIELLHLLEKQYFEIEHKAFPYRPAHDSDESHELMVLVARKAAESENRC